MLPKAGPKQPSEVLSHWYALVEGAHFSSEDFYSTVEDELARRQMPRLKKSRVEFHQGGVASDKRVYLRLARENYAFDLCAAPFGKDYFFSLRLVEKPRSWLSLFLLCTLSLILLIVFVRVTGNLTMLLALFGVIAVVLIFRRINPGEEKLVIPAEIPDIDSFLLNTAIVGKWYEQLRRDTYYRHDTRLLYYQVISEAVKRTAGDYAGEKGINLLETYEYSPIFRELYEKKEVKPPENPKIPGDEPH